MPTSTEANRRTFPRIASVLAVAFFTVTPAQSRAQSAASPAPVFDVISVKQNKSDSGGMSMTGVSDSFRGTNLDISNLIMNSYHLTSADLIFGLPGWTRSAHFDVNAKVVNPDKQVIDKLTDDQRRAMILDILKERFHFQAHLETKILPVYDLVLAKGGPKFTGGKGPNADTAAAMAKRGITASNGAMIVYDGEITGGGIPISSLVFSLTGAVGRTVIDKTGLTGNYDIELKWTPENGGQPSADNGQTDAQSGPSIFTALEEQLGLKLESAKGPVQTLVVDHVEMPTEN
jgi:uncharacterized protein (TIGR03435 family)